ncbi:hypothetical protein STRIP9103_02252, partial [Streptomyces ipomoeae 91-03]
MAKNKKQDRKQPQSERVSRRPARPRWRHRPSSASRRRPRATWPARAGRNVSVTTDVRMK